MSQLSVMATGKYTRMIASADRVCHTGKHPIEKGQTIWLPNHRGNGLPPAVWCDRHAPKAVKRKANLRLKGDGLSQRFAKEQEKATRKEPHAPPKPHKPAPEPRGYIPPEMMTSGQRRRWKRKMKESQP